MNDDRDTRYIVDIIYPSFGGRNITASDLDGITECGELFVVSEWKQKPWDEFLRCTGQVTMLQRLGALRMTTDDRFCYVQHRRGDTSRANREIVRFGDITEWRWYKLGYRRWWEDKPMRFGTDGETLHALLDLWSDAA